MSGPEIRPKAFPRTLPAGISSDRTRTKNQPFASQATSRTTSSSDRSSTQQQSATSASPTSLADNGSSASKSKYRFGRTLGAGSYSIVREANVANPTSLLAESALDGVKGLKASNAGLDAALTATNKENRALKKEKNGLLKENDDPLDAIESLNVRLKKASGPRARAPAAARNSPKRGPDSPRQQIDVEKERASSNHAEMTLLHEASRISDRRVRSRRVSSSTPGKSATQCLQNDRARRGRSVRKDERLTSELDVLQQSIRELVGNPTGFDQPLGRLPTPKLSPQVFASYVDPAGRKLEIPKTLADATQEFLLSESTKARSRSSQSPNRSLTGNDLPGLSALSQAARRHTQSEDYESTDGNFREVSQDDNGFNAQARGGTFNSSGIKDSRSNFSLDMHLPYSDLRETEREHTPVPNGSPSRRNRRSRIDALHTRGEISSYYYSSEDEQDWAAQSSWRQRPETSPGLTEIESRYIRHGIDYRVTAKEIKNNLPQNPGAMKVPVTFDNHYQKAPENTSRSKLESAWSRTNAKHAVMLSKSSLVINSTISKDNTGGDCVRNARLLAEFARKIKLGGYQGPRRGGGELSASDQGSAHHKIYKQNGGVDDSDFRSKNFAGRNIMNFGSPDNISKEFVQGARGTDLGTNSLADEQDIWDSLDDSEREEAASHFRREEKRRRDSQQNVKISKEYRAEDVTYSVSRRPETTRYIIENGRTIPLQLRHRSRAAEFPEEIRQEVIMSAVADRRSQAAAIDAEPSDIDLEFLDALPDSIRAELLAQERQERQERRGGQREEQNLAVAEAISDAR